MQFVKGPDFPTGALIMGRQGIIDAYRTGRARSACGPWPRSRRARAATASSSPSCRTRSAPTRCSPRSSELVEPPARSRASPTLNDESSGRRAPASSSSSSATRPALVILNNLYKHTPLQTSFAVNTVALVDGVPRTLNLAQALEAYIEHQVEVITRRSEFRLAARPGTGPTSSRACSRPST